MLERVAEGIYGVEADLDHYPWEKAEEGEKNQYRILARAAIAAMREPTDEMIFAGTSITSVWRDIKGSQLTINREKMRFRYQAMIDKALSE